MLGLGIGANTLMKPLLRCEQLKELAKDGLSVRTREI